ncbi:sensor domain CHASE2-containing protein [Noviherbaspirillum humi]|uniref:histidine kinase n=1 Tax=Noviherbaspirillum humi TaxID=1688639 RepID=A0A239IPY3_9BURK|nr:CHASE2 domain-containing protein [Noviherbaspirillum humi]SNS95103.1 sensor domain CHASE2-containing protein [Noviherbaspirillum humi]
MGEKLGHLIDSYRHLEPVVREWIGMSVFIAFIAAWLGSFNGIGRVDQILYDKMVLLNPVKHRDDILIIDIDDKSLREVGRWPWKRSTHAALIEQLAQAGAKVIGMDILFTEPEPVSDGDRVGGDQALALALRRQGKVVLAMSAKNPGEGPGYAVPIPKLSNAACHVGHINIEIDADGVARSVFLAQKIYGQRWTHLALAMAAAGTGKPLDAVLEETATPGASIFSDRAVDQGHAGRTHRAFVPFVGGAGSYPTVSYAEALRGEVPAEVFRNRYVLIGSTAMNLADHLPTPVTGEGGIMPGVEINANILNAILSGQLVRSASPWITSPLSIIPPLLAMACCLRFSPRTALLVTLLLMALTLASSMASFRAGLWIAPSAALLCLALAYPLWSWRRLEAAISYMDTEFRELEKGPRLLTEGGIGVRTIGERIQDVTGRRIALMRHAAQRVRDLLQFIGDSIESLPNITLVTTTDGRILLANRHARSQFKALRNAACSEADLHSLFAGLSLTRAGADFRWTMLTDPDQAGNLAAGVEASDGKGKDFIISSAPCRSASGELKGWIISMVDVTQIRAVEREREQFMRFLSHDMRGPQNAILAMLELQKMPDMAMPEEELFNRIAQACEKTLTLADDFTQLAKAQSKPLDLTPQDFHEIATDACQSMWSLAQQRKISLWAEPASQRYLIRGDRALLLRAVENLL